MLALVFANFVDGNDVRMIDSSRRLGFNVESLNDGGRSQVAPCDHLYGHDPIKAELPGLEDRAHPAARNFFQQFVVAEIAHLGPFGGGQSHARTRFGTTGRTVALIHLRLGKQALGTKTLPGIGTEWRAAFQAGLFNCHHGRPSPADA